MTTAKALPAGNTDKAAFLRAPGTHQRAGEGAGSEVALALRFRDQVFAAKAALKARRRAFWSYSGPSNDRPMDPERAQVEFDRAVHEAMDAYTAGKRATLTSH